MAAGGRRTVRVCSAGNSGSRAGTGCGEAGGSPSGIRATGGASARAPDGCWAAGGWRPASWVALSARSALSSDRHKRWLDAGTRLVAYLPVPG